MLSHGVPLRHVSATPEAAAKLSQLAFASSARRFSTTPGFREGDSQPAHGRPYDRRQRSQGEVLGHTNVRKVSAAYGKFDAGKAADSTARVSSRPVDARTFGSPGSQPGAPRARILRAPMGLRGNLQRRGRPETLVRSPNNRRTPGSQQHSRPGRQQVARRRRVAPQEEDRNEGGEERMTEQEKEEMRKYLAEKQEAERPKPVRFNPQGYNINNLRQTWPSLPIGNDGQIGSVLEKFTWMGDRLVNAHEPIGELAKRVLSGEKVYFRSSEEKEQVMEEVREMTTEKAKMLTEKKRELVKPPNVNFNPISGKEKKALLGRLVSGNYSDMQPVKAAYPLVVKDVMRNLRNNGTYQNAQTKEFVGKLWAMLPPPPKAKEKAEKPLAK